MFVFVRSTLSSGLNSIAAVILQDNIKVFCFKDLSESKATIVSKILGESFLQLASYYDVFLTNACHL